ncbi:Sodium-dependent multivitamin transporter [Trichuris trichiura]|uniref:Sodium-dependent multivitamin transporter n=1 Tax=Trichuris trichiura TaxID=36087 RepID=A0A077Z158_TRITR|nr:Sodium-dependent multivitamin transporter [Trichuris trichiura]
MYAPALALSSVTPLNVTVSILVTGLIATFYTTLGGSNAVVWTSTLQMLLIVAGLLAVLISGCINAGGMDVVWSKGVAGLRVHFSDIRPDPRVRHSVWSVTIGGTFTILTLFTVNQMGVQRYFSMPTLKSAQTMVLLNIPLNYICTSIFFLLGLILYHTYGQCDPTMRGLTSKPDQLLPFYVADKLHYAIGLSGLFVSGLYGAGLSTLSSGFTALAVVFLEDVAKPLYRWYAKGNLSAQASSVVSKFLACLCGLLVIGLAFAVGAVKFSVIQISLSIFGIVGGPVLGTFIMGMFLPFTNTKGAIAGILIGLTFTLWLGFGAIAVGITPNMLPLSMDGCEANGTAALNISMPEWQRNRVHSTSMKDNPLVNFYELSYQYYSLIGVLVTLITGAIVSALTGCQNGNFVKPTLLSPMVRHFKMNKETYELKAEKNDEGEPAATTSALKRSLVLIDELSFGSSFDFSVSSFPSMDTGINLGGFSSVDYAIFVITLAVPAMIGIYYGCVGTGQKTSRDVLLGSSKLGVIPVALALIGTYTSAVGLLGYPSEVYHLGGMLSYYLVVYAIVFPTVAFVYLPIMYPLKLISVYEYLEMRFNIVIRRMASFIFCFEMFLYISVVLYAPALALSSVTPMSITTSTLVTGLLATFYTTLGGSNAVVWTSALQVLLVIAGAFAIIITGCLEANGIEEVWAYNVAGLRMDFSDVRIDPRVRHSIWSVVIGGTFTVICQFTTNQMGVQRYFSMASLRNAQKMILWNVPLDALCLLLLMIIGMILYHAYGECDPRMLGLTTKVDQILPFYVMNKLSHATGLPGLFVASIYGAGLSTLASGFTALAAVLLQDVVTPLHRRFAKKPLSSATSAFVSKCLACTCGLVILGLAFAVGHVQSNIIQIALSIFGTVGGPLLGVFFSGMFLPFINSLDIGIAMLGGLASTLWLALGTVIVGVVPYLLPLSTSGCHINGTRPLPNVTIPDWKRNHVFIPHGYK